VLVAAEELPSRLARFRARQVQAAARAGDQLALDGRLAGCLRLSGAGERAPDDPHGDDDQEDEQEQAHGRIIPPRQKRLLRMNSSADGIGRGDWI